MAKRSRGSARPGQRAPVRRSAGQRPTATKPSGQGAATPPSSALTEAEAARAAELEEQILAQERAAEAARSRGRGSRPGADVAPAGARGESLILAAAGREYAYVTRDLRHITMVSGGLTAFLLILWVLIEVVGIVRI